MPQLDPTWFASQLFWLAITFAVLYFVLAKLVLPPLQEVISRRQQTVDGDLTRAQTLKTQAEQAKADYERALAEARGRAQALMTDAMGELKTSSEQRTKEMDQKIEANLKDATRRIAAKKEEMITVLSPTATELTTMIVEKLTQISPGSDKVDQILNEIAKGRR